ncbi:hypothetical protein [Streptomyces sp. NPDC002276]
MPGTTTISFNRPLNPPMTIELNPTHLPADLRTAYDRLAEAASAKAVADRARDTAAPADQARLKQESGEAQQGLDEALAHYAELGATSTTAVRDSAASAFQRAVEKAAASIREALDHVDEIGEAAALFVSAKPGKPPVRLDTHAALEAPVRRQLAMLRGGLKEALAMLPEDLD